MKVKTILREDEVQITFKMSEFVWLQVLLNSIVHKDNLDGWVRESEKLLDLLEQIKKEGQRAKSTTEEFENYNLEFLR